jgi:LppX_LprAFG lipoprotein
MLITRTRSLAALAAGALVLTALAGCGSDDDKSKDASAKSTASASSSPSASSSAGTDGTADAAADDGPPAAPGERLTKDNLVATMLAAMRDKKTARMTMDIGSSISADADVRYTGDGTEMKMSMSMGSTKATVILVDGTVYLRQAAGAKYQKITKDTLGAGETFDQLTALSPSSSIAAMRGAVKKVEYAGTDTVDGTKVDKYHVTTDASAMAKTLGQSGSTSDLPESVTYDLYVDRDHLMRRIDMTVSDQTIKVLVSDWGKPVTIEAPAPSEVLSQ